MFPILNEPAVIIGNKLVIADLHLGIEYEFAGKGIAIPSQSKKILDRIKKIYSKYNLKELMILGDLKHLVPKTSFYESTELIRFVQHLDYFDEISLIRGNHDVLLPKDLGIKIYPSKGIRINNCGLFHGHAYPDERVMDSKILLMAHEHPSIAFKGRFGVRSIEQCWLITKFKGKKLIVMSSFNPICSGSQQSCFNLPGHKFLSPLLKKVECVEVLLLDGIYLGNLSIPHRNSEGKDG